MKKEKGILKKRLALRPGKEATTTIDRWLNFVVKDAADPDAVLALRGPVFDVEDEWEALDLFRDLKAMAKRARQEGREAAFLDALESRCGPEDGSPDSRPAFRKFSDEWFEVHIRASDKSERDIESVESILKLHLVPFFGKLRIDEIDARQIDGYKAKKRRQKHQYGVGYGVRIRLARGRTATESGTDRTVNHRGSWASGTPEQLRLQDPDES